MAKRLIRKSGHRLTHPGDLERETCRHHEHQKCLRCGAIEFSIGLLTGIVVTAIVIYTMF